MRPCATVWATGVNACVTGAVTVATVWATGVNACVTGAVIVETVWATGVNRLCDRRGDRGDRAV